MSALDRFRWAAVEWVDGVTKLPHEGTRRVSSLQPADRVRELLPLFALGLYAAAVVKAGWLSDDAFASFRAAANVVSGHGLLSNPPERVQAFTNPLWTLLFALAYWPTKNAYAVGIGMGLVASFVTAALIAFSRSIPVLARVLAMLTLSLSQAFVDYSTSGLENPLSHCLIVGVYISARTERPTSVVALLSALLALNRFDHLLLVTPLLATLVLRAGRAGIRRELGRMALGFAPFCAWLLFATAYYGFPFPNTAYSKLNATIATSELVNQGLWYFIESATRDPLTPLVVLAGIFAPVLTRSPRLVPFSLGLCLYLAYVLRVGGDFMAGRFLSVPFVLAVVIVFHEVVPALPARLDLELGALVLFVPLATQTSPLVDSSAANCTVPESGIADERLCYRTFTGLISNVRRQKYKKHEYYEKGVAHRKNGPAVLSQRVGGLESFAAGPKVRFLDGWGLSDPLLARIPYEPHGDGWRIGHFPRELPDGYLNSVKTGKNRIEDACIRSFYERLRRVTQGPIFSWQRLKDIAYLNFVERTVTACPKK